MVPGVVEGLVSGVVPGLVEGVFSNVVLGVDGGVVSDVVAEIPPPVRLLLAVSRSVLSEALVPSVNMRTRPRPRHKQKTNPTPTDIKMRFLLFAGGDGGRPSSGIMVEVDEEV